MRMPFGILLVSTILIISLAIIYNFMIRMPDAIESDQEVKMPEQLEKLIDKKEQGQDLQSCLDSAEESFKKNWDSSCPRFGIDKQTPGCQMREQIVNMLEDQYRADKQSCLNRYQ